MRPDVQLDAAAPQAGITAGKGGVAGGGPLPVEGRDAVDQLQQIVEGQRPAATTEAPEQVPGQSLADQPAQHGAVSGAPAIQKYSYAGQAEPQAGAQVPAPSRVLQEQLLGLASDASGRPLQVLFVLHGPIAAPPPTAASVAPAAEPAGEAAPNDPR